ncbi:hypothetical protein [Azospirillum argentinense]|uniref:hypothetical protein n=1 Tax=Azospirillum argentinense TaxID=2970906 RepID=UPI0032DE5751
MSTTTTIPATAEQPADTDLIAAFGRWFPYTIKACSMDAQGLSDVEIKQGNVDSDFISTTPAETLLGVLLKLAAFVYWSDDTGGYDNDGDHALYHFKRTLPSEAERAGGQLVHDAVAFAIGLLEERMCAAEEREGEAFQRGSKLPPEAFKPSFNLTWLARSIGDNAGVLGALRPSSTEFDARQDRNAALTSLTLHSASTTVGDVALQVVIAAGEQSTVADTLEVLAKENGDTSMQFAAQAARAVHRALQSSIPVLAAAAGISPREMGLGSFLLPHQFPAPQPDAGDTGGAS